MEIRKGQIWRDRETGNPCVIVRDETEVWHKDWTIAWRFFVYQGEGVVGRNRPPEREESGWDNASQREYFLSAFERTEVMEVEQLLKEYE
jgi:hypothetical protein